jgi:hypothetical protein
MARLSLQRSSTPEPTRSLSTVAVRHAAGQAAQAFSYWVVTTFRNGRALRIEWFSDRDEALEAGGLSE